MAKVYSIREVALKDGVSEEEFERFLREEFAATPQFPGTRSYVLKGQRGQRTGGYLLVQEWESEERWRETWPTEGSASDEMRRWNEAHRGQRGLGSFIYVPGGVGTAYTAYNELGVSGG